MQSDLHWLKATLLDVAVSPYAFASQAAFDREFEAALAYCETPRSVLEFGMRTMRLFASLHDGHLVIRLFSVLSGLRGRGLLGFPMDFVLRERRMFVGAQSDPRFPTGTEILSINGLTIDALTDRVLPYVSAQIERLAYSFLPLTLLQYLFAFYPNAPAFDVAFKTDRGTTAVTLPATTFEERSRAQARFRDASNAAVSGIAGDLVPYAFSRIANDRIGYIDFRACEDEPRFKAFL